MTFQEQYKHPKWQMKRLEVLKLKGLMCEECNCENDTLNVHHPYYKKNAMIWEYDSEELQVLCEDCHKKIHTINDRIKKSLTILPIETKMYVLGVVDCLSGPAWDTDEDYIDGYTDCLTHRKQVLKNIVMKEFTGYGKE